MHGGGSREEGQTSNLIYGFSRGIEFVYCDARLKNRMEGQWTSMALKI